MTAERDRSKSIQVKCTLNRASIGKADYPFVMFNGFVAYPKRELITVDEQSPPSDELTAVVSAQIEEEGDTYYIVTFPARHGMVIRCKIDKKSQEIIPLRVENVPYEEIRV